MQCAPDKASIVSKEHSHILHTPGVASVVPPHHGRPEGKDDTHTR